MHARDLAKKFFGDFHREHLKPRGYKKDGRRFSRRLEGYTERVQFQGSAWNDATSAWRFYINFGVEFDGLPARYPCGDFPGTHCWTRIENLVPKADQQFDVTEGNEEKLAAVLVEHLEHASRHVAERISVIRAKYIETKVRSLSHSVNS